MTIRLAGSGFGIAGFALAPYLNAAFAIMTFTFVAAIMLSKALTDDTFTEIQSSALIYVLVLTFFLMMGATIGIFGKNTLQYVVSTSVYCVNFILLVIISRSIDLSHKTIERLLPIVAGTVAFGYLAGVGSSIQAILFTITCLAIYSIGHKNWRMLAFAAFPLILGFGSINRATLMALGIIIFFSAVIFRRGLWVIFFLGAPIALYNFIILVDLKLILDTSSNLYRRLNEIQSLLRGTQQLENIVALQQRLLEIDIIKTEMQSSPFFLKFFGQGFGATIDLRVSADSSVKASSLLGVSNVHNIHSLPHAIFFRYGYLGVFFLALLTLNLLRNLYSTLQFSTVSVELAFCVLYPVGRLMTALPASNFFFTDFICLALVVRANSLIRRNKLSA